MFKSDAFKYLGFGKEGSAISSLEAQELCLRTNFDHAFKDPMYRSGIPSPNDTNRPLNHPHFENLKLAEFVEKMIEIRTKRGIDVDYLRFVSKYKFHILLDKKAELLGKFIDYLSTEYPDNFCGKASDYQSYISSHLVQASLDEKFFSSYDDLFPKEFLSILDAIFYLIEKEFKIGNYDVMSSLGETMFDQNQLQLNCILLLEVDLNGYVQLMRAKGPPTWDLYKGFS